MPPNPLMIPSGVPPPVFAQSQLTPVYQMGLPHHHDQFGESQIQIQSNLIPIQNGGSQVLQELPNIYTEKPMTDEAFDHKEGSNPVLPPPPLDLPPKWKSATDPRGRTYYYHIIDRIPQWLPPPPDHFTMHQETSSSSESSDESTSSEEEDEDVEDEDGDEEATIEDRSISLMDVDNALPENSVIPLKGNNGEKLDGEENLVVVAEPKKRRDGLVQERIISVSVYS